MGRDLLKESQDVSEDSRVLLGLAKWEPTENRPGSSLPAEKKDEFWASLTSWSSLDGNASWQRGCLAVLHPWAVGASCELPLHVFMLERKWLQNPNCINVLLAEGGEGRGEEKNLSSTTHLCFPSLG